jgi:hypothetical protein
MLAHQGRRLQSFLTVWFAALLAIAPIARPSLPVEQAAARAASVQSFDLRDQPTAKAEEPGSRLRPAQPSAPGVLSRLSPVETTFGLPPPKPPLAWSGAADASLVAPKSIPAFGGEVRAAFHRSSVGTARTPTGPPS